MKLAQPVVLDDFRSVLPSHATGQAASLEWLARRHALHLGREDAESLLRLALRHACGPERIARRFHEVTAFLHAPRKDDVLGAPLSARMELFGRAARRALVELYPDGAPPDDAPDELVHVTCTGYQSPSAAQVRVAELGWGSRTRVTHAYHMGCHAAVPALRMAAGALALGASRVDVVHTELCSLHVRPGAITPEQWVIQSLFADGHARYRARPGSSLRGSGPALELLGVEEVLAPGTAGDMTWAPAEDAFAMTLARGVPDSIGDGVPALVDRLLSGLGERSSDALFAVHPGGPRILETVGERLGLSAGQLAHSFALLRERGNMSSATLPLLWASMLSDDAVRDGALVLSLGFGPGLTLAGAAFRVRRPRP